MPESEASGEAVVDVPVDTDRLAVEVPEPTVADDDFGYLFDESGGGGQPAELDYAQLPDDAGWVDPTPGHDADRFDAFDSSTWHFKPTPAPWYRSRPAALGIAAMSIAAVALVISVVLLAFRGPTDSAPGTGPPTAPSDTPSTATSTAPSTSRSLLPPPPPPPPPPPAESAPAYVPPRTGPRPTKKPEIGVTRTPVTRAPISVRPQPRGPQ